MVTFDLEIRASRALTAVPLSIIRVKCGRSPTPMAHEHQSNESIETAPQRCVIRHSTQRRSLTRKPRPHAPHAQIPGLFPALGEKPLFKWSLWSTQAIWSPSEAAVKQWTSAAVARSSCSSARPQLHAAAPLSRRENGSISGAGDTGRPRHPLLEPHMALRGPPALSTALRPVPPGSLASRGGRAPSTAPV
ncbi:hypothetical protein AAFF_G00058990 [Aldrovandia affinis]|uniref:Uncharacterized protein n=1 Tax=Aldrovandia affinis TaxID=143900 RepID=A0AAD7S0M2_9TELE|nr:hypothetical protein AAFF_G00058990 [Aldrovandia affinis]